VIHAVRGDLASVTADAVVRPATTRLLPIVPALHSLDEAAGPRFLEQTRLRHELPAGAAVVTGGGDLAAEFVVHLILGSEPDTVTTDTLRRAMEAALWQCTQWQIEILACPVPATGNLASQAAAATVLDAVQAHMRNADHPATVLIVTPDEHEFAYVSARLGQDGS
jgi:O-acetyl-ADP-ribose deacetylase (regulator of RNase III)